MTPLWVKLEDGRIFGVERNQTLVGRGPQCDIALEDPSVSRRHCEFYRRGDRVSVRDLGSANGTYVNGRRLLLPFLLEPGDIVRVGDFLLHCLGPDGSTSVPPPETREPRTPAPPSLPPLDGPAPDALTR